MQNMRCTAFKISCVTPQVEAQDGEVAAPGNRPMTFEEKRRLSQGLGALSGDKLGLVMEIIAESQRVDQVQPAT